MSAALLYGLVILSAIANAVWNALVKSAGDRALTMVAIRTVGMVLGLVALPFVDWPAPESWKWLAATAVVMFAYYALLVRSYGVGDMSVVYPLARGLALAARLPLAPAPKHARQWVEEAIDGEHLLVLDAYSALGAQAQRAWEESWFAPLLHALKDGQLARLSLLITSGDDLLRLDVASGDLWKFWRRAPAPMS